MPVLRAQSLDGTPLAYIDSCTSIQWTRKLWEIGTFEIHCSLNRKGADQLIDDRVVFLDAHRAGIINAFSMERTKARKKIVAKGSELKDLCRWRATVPGQLDETQYYGWDRYPAAGDPDAPVESVIKHYIDRHMVNPEDSNRTMPDIVIAADQARGDAIRWSSRFAALSEVGKKIGETYGVGYELYLDLDNNQYVFDTIHGADHTATSSSPVVFSTSWSNIATLKYGVDKSTYKTAAYLGGAGEDEARLIQVIYEDDEVKAGFERRETFIDCGSIDSLDDLIYEGRYRLKDYIAVRTLTGDTVPNGPYVYRQHWDLGDFVTLKSEDFGVELDVQITEVKEIYERGKIRAVPTFGKRSRNIIYDEIRRIGAVR
jgi:hypothetical protein